MGGSGRARISQDIRQLSTNKGLCTKFVRPCEVLVWWRGKHCASRALCNIGGMRIVTPPSTYLYTRPDIYRRRGERTHSSSHHCRDVDQPVERLFCPYRCIAFAFGVGVFGRVQQRCFFPIGRRRAPASDSCSAYRAFPASSPESPCGERGPTLTPSRVGDTGFAKRSSFITPNNNRESGGAASDERLTAGENSRMS